jgi:hypothetical protein
MTKRRTGAAARKRKPTPDSPAKAKRAAQKGSRRKKPASVVELADVAAKKRRDAKTAAGEATSAKARLPEDLRLEFRPFWNIKSSQFSTYVSVPVATRDGWSAVGYHSMLPAKYAKEHTLALDKVLLRKTAEAVTAASDPEHRAFAVTSLHARTVGDDQTAAEFYASCEEVPEELRKRLMFEIVDVDALCDTDEGLAIARKLAGLGAGVFGRTSIEKLTHKYFTLMGLTAVGFDLADDKHSEAELMQLMEGVAEAAEKSKLSCYARGVTSISLTSAAVAAGFLYIEGGVVKQKGADDFLKIVPFDVNDMYASLFGS